MGRPGSQIWTWTLCVVFSGMCVAQVLGGPQYMVAIPAVLEAGAESKFCASLLQPNETLTMSVTLEDGEMKEEIFKKPSSSAFHECITFKVPLLGNNKVVNFVVLLQGDIYFSKEIRKVMIKTFDPMTFIQTDKPLYLPGQTVHFRVVTLDTKFRPASRVYDVIEIEDSNENRIAQWLNKTSSESILQLSYSLNSEAREGDYQVILTAGDEKKHHSFTVEKYVLPKFGVKINTSDTVNIHQEEMEVEVCAKYTYGQPVPGSVSFSVCRLLNRHYGTYQTRHTSDSEQISDIKPPCYEEIKKTDKTGCATFVVEISNFKKLHQKVLQDVLDLTADVEEEGTGIKFTQRKRADIAYIIGKLSFIDTPKIYEKGSDVEGKIKALHYNDTPIADMDLYLFRGERWSTKLIQNLTTDNDGVAAFSFSTANLTGDITLQVSNKPTLGYAGYRIPFYGTNEHVVSMFQESSPDTKPVSSLQVQTKDKSLSCNKEEDITIKYTVVGEKQGSAMLMYLILSKGVIINEGFEEVDVQNETVTEGEVSFKLNVDSEMAPKVQVLAYIILPSETVIAHSADFSTEKCFSHQVSLEFSPSSAVPGEETTMKIKALPDSLCGISAIDQSVLIKKPGKTLDADKIFDLLPSSGYVPYEVLDSVPCLHVRQRRYVSPYPGNRQDAHKVFENAGMKVATNLFVRMPPCLSFRGREYHEGNIGYRMYDSGPVQMNRVAMASPGVMGGNFVSYAEPLPIETVRTFFPETWIWDLVGIGESGTKNVSLTVPDTITTWETEAFCLSPEGFGLAPRKEITVFQPFFLELTLPYSIIRGEHFELKATVFNYLSSCIMVSVTPKKSSDYTLTPLSGDKYTSCLCGNERKTLSWTMTPSALGVMNVSVTAEAMVSHVSCDNNIVSVPERGRIDVVTRSLIVKAEGVEMSKVHNVLLCPKDEALTEAVEIQLPENVINGSARASVSVMGDILGRALKNLDGLLRMPYGCGEQNMALLSPNIYILHYLKNTEQLTPAILEKSTNFLTSGYQRQLNYQHHDGAYSTFGSGAGNTWLTAFVMRSLSKAQSFIFIDPKNIEAPRSWLENNQRGNGCFVQSGKLFNNRMKGGVSDEVTLTAYIAASLLEMNVSVDTEMVNKSLSCLKESIDGLSNTYTAALMAYVFTLAGDMDTRAHLLQQLDLTAIKRDGFLHWSQTEKDTSASLSVEISSYVMLAKLSASPTAEDLGYSVGIVRWLTTQQNYYGGFSSTQDTVVALQALALYSTLVFSPGGSSKVTVQAPSDQLMFEVNQNNKLLYQENTLQDMTGKYEVEVNGSMCASIQIALHYNIPTPKQATDLSVSVKLLVQSDCDSRKLDLMLTSLYQGKESSTNMVILHIKMLSGFVPDPVSLNALKGALLVNRVEQKEDHVLVYLEELPKDIPIHHTLGIIREQRVENLKPAVVSLYDYYQPSDKAETEYVNVCATG
ncbi:alpha-2-macroglobulin-like [Solea solea]|uniref:alpha-2-macroglobulin-like n=1 Tax=Solea solea TaxID=90069 RepID=UPI00272B09F5|nr:alpha-2-macroglobulin-like [Solea solea]